jgi:hypothetical protein
MARGVGSKIKRFVLTAKFVVCGTGADMVCEYLCRKVARLRDLEKLSWRCFSVLIRKERK